MENKNLVKKENENYIIYDAVFINKTWRVGTKNDPNKEYGVIKFNIEVPMAKPDANGETTYVVSIEEFVFDKSNFPEKHIDRYTPIQVAYLPPLSNPQGKMKFVKIL